MYLGNILTVAAPLLVVDVKHGVVSPRRFYHELSKTYAKFPASKLSQPPVSLHGQLMWREYNNLMGYTTPNFDKMVGNPIARQVRENVIGTYSLVCVKIDHSPSALFRSRGTTTKLLSRNGVMLKLDIPLSTQS